MKVDIVQFFLAFLEDGSSEPLEPPPYRSAVAIHKRICCGKQYIVMAIFTYFQLTDAVLPQLNSLLLAVVPVLSIFASTLALASLEPR